MTSDLNTLSETQKHFNEFAFSEAILSTPKLKAQPSAYIIDPALYRAVEVAILLKQPLLLTGEPGTGKTRLAEKLAFDLHHAHPDEYLSTPLVFHTKTISSYIDLFYFYDALSHFHDAHLKKNKTPNGEMNEVSGQHAPVAADYIHLQALGQAIILSNPDTARKDFCYKMMKDLDDEPSLTDGMTPKSSVVLIDEVDKAPRDFANDLLNELDRYEFFVKEDFNNRYSKGPHNIFLILTSNSEKNLPDAFLRRCIFYHIDFPGEEQLQQIVMSQLFPNLDDNHSLPGHVETKVKEYVTHFKSKIRDTSADKKPATAELISWTYYLKDYIMQNISIEKIPLHVMQSSYSILAKDKNDLLRLNENLTMR
jgi:MoxR-like ATPase